MEIFWPKGAGGGVGSTNGHVTPRLAKTGMRVSLLIRREYESANPEPGANAIAFYTLRGSRLVFVRMLAPGEALTNEGASII